MADPRNEHVQRQRAFVATKGALPAARCSLSQLKQVYATEVDVQLRGIALKAFQRQVVSWMLDNERHGFDLSKLVTLRDSKDAMSNMKGGVIAMEMGMGKTACAIAACKQNRMPTLVVAPALTCVQWCHQFSEYAPELSNAMVYCTSQKRNQESLMLTDVVVLNSTSNLIDCVAKRVQRVIVDESHEVCKGSSGEAIRFLHNLSCYPNVQVVWLVSGTP
ncbi:MAG: SNF2-related protein, partial [Actinomycetota bacterium]|nr:SNF2-related protein [Actinomycetota bacterium]